MAQPFSITTDEIERIIDADGAWNLALAIEIVLGEKADVMKVNGADNATIRAYRKFARRFKKLAEELGEAEI